MNELIVVKQLPVIEERLQSISADIEAMVTDALKLVVTEDTVKTVKKQRTEIGQRFKELESERKKVKTAVMAPYDAFEAVYKRYVTDVFKPADAKLKMKIDEAEDVIRQWKVEAVSAYYDECAERLKIDFIPFSNAGIRVLLSDSIPAKKKESDAFLAHISDDMTLIATMGNDAEVLVEYKQCLNVSKAVLIVNERHDRIAAENLRREREEERIQAPVQPEMPDAVKSLASETAAPIAEDVEFDFDPFAPQVNPQTGNALQSSAPALEDFALTVHCTRSSFDALLEHLRQNGYTFCVS